MNVAKLISILQTQPMDSIIQIGYYADMYDIRPYITDVRTLTIKEAEKFEKHPQANKPNRVILS